MSIDLFQKFIDDSQGYNGYICFTGRGENSLHPKFKQLVEILHHENRTYKTRILTNGYKLKDKFYWFNQFDSIIMNTYSSKEEMEERKKILPRAKHRYWDQSLKPEDWGETTEKLSQSVFPSLLLISKCPLSPLTFTAHCSLPNTK